MQHSAALRSLTSTGLLLFLSSCGGGDSPAFSPPPPPPVSLDTDVQRVFDQISFASPVALIQAPGDNSRWFAVEQSGIVRVFDNDQNVMPAGVDVFVDIRGRVSSGGERGLLGMAFHPDFSANGRVYLSYTGGGSALTSFISEFTVDPVTGNLDPLSEVIIITVLQDSNNHNGGNIAFGPDDMLYIGFGDGGGSGDQMMRGQDTTNLLGTIVRLNVDGAMPYTIPSDNPFPFPINPVSVQGFCGGNCPEIYAWGFRNPWRFSFDSQTGELWVGDVGQNLWEEIDRVELGLNYGWNEREGAHCFAATCRTNNEDPITEYDHSVGNSITGGFVYRGVSNPNLQGYYVFGDFGSGRIWAVLATAAQGTVAEQIDATSLGISSFAQGEDGELYALDYFGGGIYQIIAAP